VLDAAFGKVTSTRTPMRQLQESLKFYFRQGATIE